MVLPLLAGAGLLAAGGQVGLGFLRDWEEDRDTTRRSQHVTGILDGLGSDASYEDQTSALMRGGILNPDTAMGDLLSLQRGRESDAASMARTQVSAGPAYINANIAQEKWATEQSILAEERSRTSAQREHLKRTTTDLSDNTFIDYASPSAVQDAIDQGAKAVGATLYEDIKPPSPVDQPSNFNEWLAQEKWNKEQSDSMFAASEGFHEAVTPLVDLRGRIKTARSNVNTADVGGLSSTQEEEAAGYINSVMGEARSNYWRNVLGRTDAPTETEFEELERLFPIVTGYEWFSRNKQRVSQALALAESQLDTTITRNQEDYTRTTGQTAPNISPLVKDVPAGWTRDTSAGGGL